MRKPDGLYVGGVYRMNAANAAPRPLVCLRLWFSGEGFHYCELYEPATDKVNELTADEITRAMDSGQITLHQPETGKRVGKPSAATAKRA